MAVTPDEYELPLYVSENVNELAEVFNVKPINILSSISHHRDGRISGRKFIRIDIEDE